MIENVIFLYKTPLWKTNIETVEWGIPGTENGVLSLITIFFSKFNFSVKAENWFDVQITQMKCPSSYFYFEGLDRQKDTWTSQIVKPN